MCDMCDGMSKTEQLRHVQEIIDEHGVAVCYVEDNDPQKCFGYTVGLTPHNAQEFLVRGMNHEDTSLMLNGFADSVLERGEHFDHGHTANWRDGRILHFNHMRGAREFACDAFNLYGPRARVLEIHFAQPGMPAGAGSVEYRNLALVLADARLLPQQLH
ncbi:DUF4262 domain-containing protein [Paeniglutamicibacter sp. ABSL32-1]|uniref:DUF4262 domain-containing protein n=1 Tax=Paeniglutamicibacter quisquiliarum TaxID=2849498 RepID=UPI001C2D8351|nr:DUF4262 domain-containing protein [Paeniglutamicibacter quisquiliarum]MBV1777945.1 DUF4262 domain-containing protein [Paeniglutamicibacter quisquiliarum]